MVPASRKMSHWRSGASHYANSKGSLFLVIHVLAVIQQRKSKRHSQLRLVRPRNANQAEQRQIARSQPMPPGELSASAQCATPCVSLSISSLISRPKYFINFSIKPATTTTTGDANRPPIFPAIFTMRRSSVHRAPIRSASRRSRSRNRVPKPHGRFLGHPRRRADR